MSWVVKQPLDAVVFDCDGTLSELEGIDQLARDNGVGEHVQALTESAMSEQGMSVDIYQQRLALVKPTAAQVTQLGEQYIATCTAGIQSVVACFQRLGKAVFVLSAGIHQAVLVLARYLGIPDKYVYAVEVFFDEQGAYQDFDRESPLVENNGKPQLIARIKQQYPHILHVGDGLNDVAAHTLVSRFVGYGGAFYRPKVADASDFYLKSPSLLALLPLGVHQSEISQLTTAEQQAYQTGLAEYLAAK